MKTLEFKHFFLEYVFYALVFGLVGGALQGIVFCSDCWDDTALLWRRFSYMGAFWAIFTLGSQLGVKIADQHIDWIAAPMKRFFLGLALMIVFTLTGFILTFLLFQVVIWGRELGYVISKLDFGDFLGPLFITFGVNAFMHGRQFLLAWRQNAINFEKLKTEQIATQYDSLKNQVNPHFLFNSLNALTSLVYDDQEKAVEFIRQLSKVYRYVLDTKDKEVVEMGEEMEFLESYMYLQKIRFDENLIFETKVSGQAMKSFVVPISLQMLLENAIKHNVISQNKPLTVKLYESSGYLVVANNLQEKMHKDSTGIGLSNIKDRYSYITDKKVEVEKTDDHFHVKLPLITPA